MIDINTNKNEQQRQTILEKLIKNWNENNKLTPSDSALLI